MYTKTKKSNGFAMLCRSMVSSDEFYVLMPLLAIILITTIIRPDFLSVNNFSAILTQIPFVTIVGIGTCFCLMTGQVDLSTGKVAGLGGIIFASLMFERGWHYMPAILIALVICGAVGFINGFLVTRVGISDFVATLGMLFMAGGARYLFIKGYQLTLGDINGFYLDDFFSSRVLGIQPQFWIMVGLIAIVAFILKKTVWGKHMLATGDNAEMAKIAGINVKRNKHIAYILSALFAGFSGILLTLNIGVGLPETGDGWEFRAIAGCVVGGVSLSGGKATTVGVFIGVLLMFVAENAIIFIGLPSTLRTAVQGVLMMLAVYYDLIRQRKKIRA